jgi:hypothetical protein
MKATKGTFGGVGAALALTLFLTACSGISTSTDFDPAANFGSYGTYSWIPTQGHSTDDLTDSRIRSAVDASLAAKGLDKVDSGGDLAVGYQVTTAERSTYNTVSTGWGGGYGRRGWGGAGMGMTTTTEQNYTEGTIILAMFDEGTESMVWKGTATATVDPGKSPEDRAKSIQGAVEKMLGDFPPGS